MLFDYQQKIISDPSRLVCITKSRRIGGSFAVTLKHAALACGATLPGQGEPGIEPATGTDQIMIATEERKAADLLSEMVRHIRSLELVFGTKLLKGEPALTKAKLLNGRTLMALPAGNANACHGWTAGLVIDEASRIPNAYEVATAALPVADETVRHPEGLPVSLVSTPLGAAGLFYDIAQGKRGAAWSKHVVSIHDAVKDGFPNPEWSLEKRLAWLESKRAEVADPEVFASSYECNFLAAQGMLVSAELYDQALCSRDEIPKEGVGTSGYDVARTKDASSIVSGIVDDDGVLWVIDCVSKRGMNWDAQMEWAGGIAKRMGRMGVDATGIGSKPCEDLQAMVPGVTAVNFSSSTQREQVITGLRSRFLRGKIRIPRDLHELRSAVLSWRREITPSGATRWVLPRSSLGHNDEAIALALASHVAPSSTGIGTMVSTPHATRRAARSLLRPSPGAYVRPSMTAPGGRLFDTAAEQRAAARRGAGIGGFLKGLKGY